MNCGEFEKEWQELDDPSLLSPGMEEHRRNCSPCGEWVRDVNLIRWQARQMIETEQPPERTWLNIRRRLDQEGLVREPGGRPFLARVLAFRWLPRLAEGLAYASVFVLALLGVEYLRDLGTPVAAPPPAPPTAMVRGPVPPPAQASKRDEAIQRVIEKAPPEKQAILVRNWQQLNSSADEWQRFVAEHPDDLLAPRELYTVYEQRERFFESLMLWSAELSMNNGSAFSNR